MSHRSLKILTRFNIGTWKRCRLFIEMEVIGDRPIEIYDYLMKTRKNPKKWDLEKVHDITLPTLSKRAFQNELSRLTLAIESFISYEELKEEKQYKDLLLRQYYLRNSDHKEWESNFHKSIERYNKNESMSFLDQFDLMRILHQAYFSTHPIKKSYVIDILQQLQEVSQSTSSAYLSYIHLIYHQENGISKNPQSQLKLQRKAALSAELFDDIDNVIKDFNLTHAENIIQRLDDIGQSINLEIKIIIYGLLRQNLLSQLSKGNETERIKLTIKVMNSELESMEQAIIPINPSKIYRLVSLLNYIGDIDSMELILNKYENSMSGQAFFELSKATVLILKNMVSEAITHLNQIEVDSFRTKYLIRSQLIRAYSKYYDDVDFCLDEIQKFRKWIRTNKTALSENSEIGLSRSMEILRDMLRKKDVTDIVNKIYDKQPLAGRMWLLKEVKERYNS